ncbi:MAG: T9SS type A sorting domain-containing protein [Bacteroidia bacterium]|nr:T9SS type A sorting domain-containing protein [Bacteroidia bacterium]
MLKTDLHAGVGTQRMDLPLVPAGIYLLRIESAGKQQTFKLRID